MPNFETETMKHFLAFVADVKDAINEERRSVRFIISSDKVDRDDERVEVSAVVEAMKDFAKNPTALACHQHRLSNGSSPVIGSWDTDSFRALKHHSEMDLVFAKTALGEEYWQLYRDKHMRAVSIGFRTLEGHEEVVKERRLFVITKIELYEISCVPVGSNRQALSKIKDFAWLQQQPEQDGLKSSKDSLVTEIKTSLDNFASRIEASIDEVKDMLIIDSGELAEFGELSGSPSEPSAGDMEKPGQLLDKLQTLINSYGG